MEDDLKAALEELVAAEEAMIDGDPDDDFYTAACHVAAVYREGLKPKFRDLSPPVLGFAFNLDEDGRATMREVDR